jgi:phospholipid transport system transporter-binding protein
MQVVDGIAIIEGDLILDNSTRMLAEGEAAIRAGAGVFDMAGVDKMDSSALSLLLALRRSAQEKSLKFVNVPASLASLAVLYGISDLV